MEISVRNEAMCTVIAVTGRLDTRTAPEWEKQCGDIIQSGGSKFVLDLTALEYVSSAGLRCVLSIAKKLKASGGALVLCGLSGLVKEVFSVSGFDSFFPVYETAEEAVANF